MLVTSRGRAVGIWGRIVVLWLAGVCAAVALGAPGPAAGAIRSDTGLSLVGVGWATSIIIVMSAALGLPTGWWVRRIGVRRPLFGGVATLALAGAVPAVLDGSGALFAGRAVQGLGFLLVVVGVPVALTGITSGSRQALALTLWGTAIPVGLGVASALGGALTPVLGWQGWLAVVAIMCGVLLPGLFYALPADAGRSPAAGGEVARQRQADVVLLAIAFACTGLIGVALPVVLPTYLVDVLEVDVRTSGVITSAMALAAVPGSLLAGLVLHRRTPLTRLVPFMVLIPLAVIPLFSTATLSVWGVGGAGVAFAVQGAFVSIMFALVPRLVTGEGGVALANGLLAQFGSVGTLVGPPLAAWCADRLGWPMIPVAVGLLASVSAVLLFFVARRSR